MELNLRINIPQEDRRVLWTFIESISSVCLLYIDSDRWFVKNCVSTKGMHRILNLKTMILILKVLGVKKKKVNRKLKNIIQCFT